MIFPALLVYLLHGEGRGGPGALRFSFEEPDRDDEHAYHRYRPLDRHPGPSPDKGGSTSPSC